MKVETAAMRGVDHLYNYQRYKTDWLRRTVLHNQVYFSNPKEFNDPWDCRPRYNEDSLNDSVYCEQLIRSLDANARKRASENFDERTHNQKIAALRANPSSLLKDHLVKAADAREKVIHQRYRVYCLVPRADSALMWAHYADKHRGICLEFSRDAIVFDGTFKVIYCDKYPKFEPFAHEINKLLLPLITKSENWRYEEEYRTIAQEKTTATPHNTLMTENNYFDLPAKMLKSIIMGR